MYRLSKLIGHNKYRIAILMSALFIIIAVAVLAQYNEPPTYSDEHYQTSDTVHIDIDMWGYVSARPHQENFTIEEDDNGNIFIMLPNWAEAEHVVVNMPFGRDYWVLEAQISEEYGYEYEAVRLALPLEETLRSQADLVRLLPEGWYSSFYNAYGYEEYQLIITPAYQWGYWLMETYSGYIYEGSNEYDYDNNDTYPQSPILVVFIAAAPEDWPGLYYNLGPYEEYEYYTGERPEYDQDYSEAEYDESGYYDDGLIQYYVEGHGYIGIMPLAARSVYFDLNHSGLPPTPLLTTTALGAIGAHNMPTTPIRQGYVFMAWTRTQDGLTTYPFTATGNASGIQFTGVSTITALQDPATVYAQWGHSVTFVCTSIALGTAHAPRFAHVGMSVAETNLAFDWTIQQWPDNPGRAGFTFLGWYTRNPDGTYNQRIGAFTSITQNVVVFARWQAGNVLREVEFDPNGGTTPLTPELLRVPTLESGIIGAAVWAERVVPNNPTRPGYGFLGWTRHQDPTTPVAGAGWNMLMAFTQNSNLTPYDSPMTVYAQWGHLIVFNCNYTTLNMNNPANWNTSYVPRFVWPGSTFAVSQGLPWVSAQLAQAWPANPPPPAGYVFDGWFTAGGELVNNATPITENIYVYARWRTTVTASQATIIYNLNDGGLTDPQDFPQINFPFSTWISAAAFPPVPTRPDHHFIAWTRTQDGLVVPPYTNTPGAHFYIWLTTGNTSWFNNTMPIINVYAQWGYEVSFNGNGITLAPGNDRNNANHYMPRVVNVGESFADSQMHVWTPAQVWPYIPTRVNYVFLGWYTRNEFDDYDQHVNWNTPITEDTALYARWRPVADGVFPQVHFNPNDGVATAPFPHIYAMVAPGNIGIVEWIFQPAITAPNHPDGYHLLAWTRTQDALGTLTGNLRGELFTSTSHISQAQSPYTVYAQWGYKVTFACDSGGTLTLPAPAVPPTNQNSTSWHGPRIVLPGLSVAQTNTRAWANVAWPGAPGTLAGHTFLGWFSRDEFGVYEQLFTADTPINGDITLYARWIYEGDRYVIFDPNGGSPAAPFTVPVTAGSIAQRSIGQANWDLYVVPYQPTRTGYHFMTWTRTQLGYGEVTVNWSGAPTERFNATSFITPAEGAVTVFAQWGHMVSFHCDIMNLYIGTNRNNSTHFLPRIVSSGRSFLDSQALQWVASANPAPLPPQLGAQVWPVLTPNTALYPQLEHHFFLGWYTKSGGVFDQRFTNATPITQDTQLYARWATPEFIFNPNGGVPATPFSVMPTAGSGVLPTSFRNIGAAGWADHVVPNQPLHPNGYLFMAWTRNQEGTGFPVGAAGTYGIAFNANSSVQLQHMPYNVYAQWGHQVSFWGNGVNLTVGNNPANPAHYMPRMVRTGRSMFQSHQNYSWTSSVWPNDPERFGHDFMGWWTRVNGEYDTLVTEHCAITECITLHARWQGLTVIFNPNDGSGPPFEERQTVAFGNMGANMPPNPERTGYAFMGWTRTPSGLGPQLAFLHFTSTSVIFPHESPLMVYAQWGHSVTFNGNGVTLAPGNNPNLPNHFLPRIASPGLSVVETHNTFHWWNLVWPQNPPERVGHVFGGWWTEPETGGFQYDANTPIHGNRNLYARWIPRRVYFNPNDGSTPPFDYRHTQVNTNSIGAANFPPPPTPRPGDLNFIAWTRTQDGQVTPPYWAWDIAFTNASAITVAQHPYTVYAQWGHRITFMPNGATWTGATLTGTGINQYGPRYALPGVSVYDTNQEVWTTQTWPNNPTRAGHFFMGWWTTPDTGGFEYNRYSVINGNRTLYARWQTLQVNFDPNGGTPPGIEERWTQANGTIANFPVVTKPGANFREWTRTQDGVTVAPFTSNWDITTGMIFGTSSTIPYAQSPATVFAQWSHTVQFFNQSVQTNTFEVLTGRTAFETNALWWINAAWPVTPTRAGFTFMGWYTRDNGNYDQMYTNSTPIYAHRQLHARWEPTFDKYVEFYANGGTPTVTIQTLPNGSIGAGNMPDNPSRIGYAFMGWTRNQDGAGVTTGVTDGVHFTETSTITGSQSVFRVYAQWGHRIHFNGNGAFLYLGDNPGNANHYISRVVSAHPFGRSLACTNALVWTTNQVWPTNPIHPSGNHSFAGWYTMVDGEFDQPVTINTPLTGDVAVYARWTLRVVHFNPNGGTIFDGAETRITLDNGTVGSTMPNELHASRGDHYFMAWTRTPVVNDPGPQFLSNTFVNFHESPLTVYAQWGFRVTFICPFGSIAITDRVVAAQQSVAASHALGWTNHQPWPATPFRSGHTFTGWVVVGTGELNDQHTPITNNRTLFATWSLDPIYTVTFDYGPGVLGAGHSNTRQARAGLTVNASSSNATAEAYRTNVGITWPRSAPLVTRSVDGRGMIMESWWTEPGGEFGTGNFWALQGIENTWNWTDTAVPPGGLANTPVTEDITVYPAWVFRVTFHPNGGWVNNVIAPGAWTPPSWDTVRHIRDIPAIGPGYLGGTVNANGFVRLASGVAVPIGMPPWELMSRTGFFFVGWWSHQIPPHVRLGDEALHGFGDAYQFMGNETINANRTVFARWIPIPPPEYIHVPPTPPPTRTVIFRVNEGYWWSPDFHQEDHVVTRVSNGTTMNAMGAPMPQFPVRYGYIFMGWYDDDTGPQFPNTPDTGRFHSHTTIAADTTRIVYAHWMPYHIVTFDPNDGVFSGTNLRAVAHDRTLFQMFQIWNNGGTGTSWSGTTLPPPGLIPPGGTAPRPGHPSSTYGFNFYNWGLTWTGDIMQRISRANHHILGWNNNADGTGAQFLNNVPITEDRTVFAQWGITFTFHTNQFGITAGTQSRSVALNFSANTNHFHPNTGASPIFFPTGNIGDANRFWQTILLYELYRPAALIGWNTEPDGSGHWVSESTVITTLLNGDPFITGNTNLFAQWGNMIVFLPNGAPASSGLPSGGVLRRAEAGIQMWQAEDPGDPTVIGLPNVNHVAGIPLPYDWDPYWGWDDYGISFWGWNTQSDNRGRAIEFNSDANDPIAIFAIWNVNINYHPTGGSMVIGPGPTTNPHLQATPLGSLFGLVVQPTTMHRPGWVHDSWNEYRWGLYDTHPSFSPVTLINRSHDLYAQWTANVTFLLQGGFIDYNPANVIRTVPEGENATTVNWAHGPGMPPNPVKPAHTFQYWYMRGPMVNGEYTRVPFTGTTNIGAWGHTNVFARWEPIRYSRFSFIKTNNEVYDDPYNIVPINGATFRLYREVPHDSDNWVFVNQQTSSTTVHGDGWLVYDHVLTYAGRYRLVETYAPRGYDAPTGYWIIQWDQSASFWDHTLWVITIVPHGGNPLFIRRHNASVGDYVWHVGNSTVYIPFTFIKADHYLQPEDDYIVQPLPGAQFRFYMYTPRSNSGIHSDLVTEAGILAQYWTLVYAATSSDPDGLVTAPLWEGGNTFHMVEVAPPGFVNPPGQWRITLNVDGNNDVYIVQPIDSVGGNPEFRLVMVNSEDVLHVYNLPEYRPFEFIKVDEAFLLDLGHPPFDPDVHALDGAVFRLYRYSEHSQNPGNWDYVTSYTSGDSGVYGLVRFDLRIIGRYKLVEYTAPFGFVLQRGYWIIDWSRVDPDDPDTWVLEITHHDGNHEFETRPVMDDDNEYQDVLFVGNEPMPILPVHKTDYRLYEQIATGSPDWAFIDTFLLPGAEFVLVRYNNLVSGTSPSDELVSTSMMGDAEGEWSIIWEGTSVAVWDDSGSVVVGLPMEIMLDTQFRYFQLIETLAPPGFVIPMGQWRIELAANTITSPDPSEWYLLTTPFRTHWVRITTITETAQSPGFHRNPDNEIWYVGNWLMMELPLMGGMGRAGIFAAGAAVMTMGLGLLAYIVLKKNGVDVLKHVKVPHFRRG